MTFLPTYLSYKKGKPKNTPFFRRKVCQRTSHRIHHFIWTKAFEVPRNFSRKVSCVGVWGGQPQLTTNTKNAEKSAFFILSEYVGTAVRGPCFKALLKKLLKNPKNFCTNHTTLFGRKLLRFQRTFHEKSFGRGLGQKPQHSMRTKKRGKIRVFYIAIKTTTPAENPAGVVVHKINIKQK